MSIPQIRQQLKQIANNEKAIFYQRFFKTAPGEYGHGDKFIGVTVPELRKLAKQHHTIDLIDVSVLLESTIHEERLMALFILIHQYNKADIQQQTKLYKYYLKNRKYVNNWDLVDSSCHKILGPYLFERDREPLYKLARSNKLWDKRIGMMTTYYFIKRNDFADALNIAEILLNDEHDLIHKVVGWMLREVGNMHRPTEEKFLKQHYSHMPRTMLRYAIEKFPQARRKQYLNGTI